MGQVVAPSIEKFEFDNAVLTHSEKCAAAVADERIFQFRIDWNLFWIFSYVHGDYAMRVDVSNTIRVDCIK